MAEKNKTSVSDVENLWGALEDVYRATDSGEQIYVYLSIGNKQAALCGSITTGLVDDSGDKCVLLHAEGCGTQVLREEVITETVELPKDIVERMRGGFGLSFAETVRLAEALNGE